MELKNRGFTFGYLVTILAPLVLHRFYDPIEWRLPVVETK